jgi:hypothetical protein
MLFCKLYKIEEIKFLSVLYIAKAKRQSKMYFYLIDVLPEYQNKAVTAILLKECYKHLKKRPQLL